MTYVFNTMSMSFSIFPLSLVNHPICSCKSAHTVKLLIPCKSLVMGAILIFNLTYTFPRLTISTPLTSIRSTTTNILKIVHPHKLFLITLLHILIKCFICQQRPVGTRIIKICNNIFSEL